MQLSEACSAILDEFVKNCGEVPISQEEAARLFRGTEETTVGALHDDDLIQAALITIYGWFAESLQQVAGMKILLETRGGNRASRRHP